MPIVTQLKPQRDKVRVNVYLDDKFAFGIDLDNLVRYGIKVEKFFSEEEIEKIIFAAEFQKSLDKVIRFAMTRPRSMYEVEQWFRRKEIPDSLKKNLIEKLEKLDLLDDYKFAQWWIEQRLNFKKKGKIAMEQELAQKGIEREIIERAFATKEIDEPKLAKELLDRYGYKWERFKEPQKTRKKQEFLLRRGFGWEVVKSLVRE